MTTGTRTRRTLSAAAALALLAGLGNGHGALAGSQAGNLSLTQSTASYKIELDVEPVQTMLTPQQAATAGSGEVMLSMSNMPMGAGAMTMSSGNSMPGGTDMSGSGSMSANGNGAMSSSGMSSMSAGAQMANGSSSMTTSGGSMPAGAGPMSSAGSQPSSSSSSMSMSSGASSGSSMTMSSSAMPMSGGSQATTMTAMGDASPNHHVEVHIWDAAGNVISNIAPAITITSQATGATWTMDQVMEMYDIQVGQSDTHFGNNIHLDDGTYSVTVTIGPETTTFGNVMVSSGM